MIKVSELEETACEMWWLVEEDTFAINAALPALLRLARAAKAEDDQRTRLLRGEYGNDEQRYTEDHDRTLRELYEALSAFDFTD